MKIAILSPSPIPFTIGGAEKLWSGLYNYINKHTVHQCELVKIPTKEDSFWNLIDSYHTFYNLDLSHFDMVISGKYPAWMTSHPNHHIYMLHTLRGLYDLYDEKAFSNNQRINFDKNISINEMFKKLYKLKESNIQVDFPSKFAKDIIHYFDSNAMKNIKIFSAISNTVAKRESYFPLNTEVKVIYPPTTLVDLKCDSYEYFFTASRLDSPKRIDLIIKAYKKANTEIPLKIAGTGSELENLKELIVDDDRIELLEFISDLKLVEYYSRAYAIIFIPKEEDYGLITIEAMMSKKPVITVDDSGGVLEFIKHNKTGLISKPDVDDLAHNIKCLSDDLILTKELGKTAYQFIQSVNWENCVRGLLKSQLTITVVTTYPVYPPRGGGQNRVFYLYKELAKFFNITIVSLVHSSVQYSKKLIAQNLYEIQIPKTNQHEQKEQEMQQKTKIAITDIALMDIYDLTPDFIKIIKDQADISDFVITTSPYIYPLLKQHTSKPIIYESQNVEYSLKKMMLENTPYTRTLFKRLYEVEKECYLNSFLTTTCSKEDAINLQNLYGKSKKDIPFISNGVDLDSTPYFSKIRKQKSKIFYGFGDKKIVIFMGSAHKPNIDAVYEILKLAKRQININFIILGGIDSVFKDKIIPQNVTFTGIVDDKEKSKYLAVSDIALNPMLEGSGTNLKMLDYMASGIPILSTEVGARGLNIPNKLIAVADIKDWNDYLENLDYYTDTKEARRFVQNYYSWESIALIFKGLLFL